MFRARRLSFCLLATLLCVSLPIGAVAPPAPPSCTSTSVPTATNATPVAISASGTPTITSTIVIAGGEPFLYDTDVFASISHTATGDLDITLTSPAGTVVTLSSDNAGAFDDIFNNTTWDDDADVDGTVPFATNASSTTDTNYSSNGQTGFPLTPEEPLAAFVGEDPNGVWTLTINDDTNGDGGTLNSWSLNLTTLPAAPTILPAIVVSNTTPVPIPAAGTNTVTSTINVPTGGSIFDVNVTANISHTNNGTLQMNLISPAGTRITLSSNNGGANDNVFSGTTWDDDADPDGAVPYASNDGLATDHAYADGVVVPLLAPEEALGAFIGEDPTGVWTLRVADTADLDGGAINSWSLSITTATCAVAGSSVSGTKTVSGTFAVGGTVNYTVTLNNAGAGAQPDNAGDEFTDVLPSTLTLVSANATSGAALATIGTNTVTWNGSIAPAGSVTITITATILPAATGTTVSNSGTIAFDADGNATNESSASTDDPGQGGAADPTSFLVAPAALSDVPAVSPLGLVMLIGLMAGVSILLLKRS